MKEYYITDNQCRYRIKLGSSLIRRKLRATIYTDTNIPVATFGVDSNASDAAIRAEARLVLLSLTTDISKTRILTLNHC